jgi:hypothetical protein
MEMDANPDKKKEYLESLKPRISAAALKALSRWLKIYTKLCYLWIKKLARIIDGHFMRFNGFFHAFAQRALC